MIFLVLKISSHFANMAEEEAVGDAVETDPLLLQQKAMALYAYYGACSSSSNHDHHVCLDSDDEEANARLCVICYDEEQNSFFVPCGHSATCIACARRIYNEGNKVCPVCRKAIGRVKKF
ncbi:E3 ubiquitin-protein ligase APD1 [Linum perenne]